MLRLGATRLPSTSCNATSLCRYCTNSAKQLLLAWGAQHVTGLLQVRGHCEPNGWLSRFRSGGVMLVYVSTEAH
jgi:hypothetical protein